MENQEIINRFLAALKNGKGMTVGQFAKNNNIDILTAFATAFRLVKQGEIVKVNNGGDSVYYLR